jgi:hypothetical protein
MPLVTTNYHNYVSLKPNCVVNDRAAEEFSMSCQASSQQPTVNPPILDTLAAQHKSLYP